MCTLAGSLLGARGDRVIYWSLTRGWGPRQRGSSGHLPAIRLSGADWVIYRSPTPFGSRVVRWCRRHLLPPPLFFSPRQAAQVEEEPSVLRRTISAGNSCWNG